MAKKLQVLFIQGGGEGAHDDWDDKLVASLRRELGQNYEVVYPRMPREADPSYARWKPAIEKELETLKEGAILVGHSIGGAMLLKLLSEASPTLELGGIFLVAAPFVGGGGWSSEGMELPAKPRLPQGVPLHLFHGLADETAPPEHVGLYARAIPRARVHRLPARDHQLNDDLTEIAAEIRSLEG